MSGWIEDTIKSIGQAFTAEYCEAIDQAIDLLVERFQSGHKLLVCGNGGSAADAQHIAAELVGRFLLNRRGLPAVALSANTSVLTAWSNDHEFESVFARQVEALGKPGDVLWGISTSGKSKNVIQALKMAQDMGLVTLGMSGNHGGAMQEWVDYPLFIAERHTPRVQEVHLITYHRICEQVEQQLLTTADAPL